MNYIDVPPGNNYVRHEATSAVGSILIITDRMETVIFEAVKSSTAWSNDHACGIAKFQLDGDFEFSIFCSQPWIKASAVNFRLADGYAYTLSQIGVQRVVTQSREPRESVKDKAHDGKSKMVTATAKDKIVKHDVRFLQADPEVKVENDSKFLGADAEGAPLPSPLECLAQEEKVVNNIVSNRFGETPAEPLVNTVLKKGNKSEIPDGPIGFEFVDVLGSGGEELLKVFCTDEHSLGLVRSADHGDSYTLDLDDWTLILPYLAVPDIDMTEPSGELKLFDFFRKLLSDRFRNVVGEPIILSSSLPLRCFKTRYHQQKATQIFILAAMRAGMDINIPDHTTTITMFDDDDSLRIEPLIEAVTGFQERQKAILAYHAAETTSQQTKPVPKQKAKERKTKSEPSSTKPRVSHILKRDPKTNLIVSSEIPINDEEAAYDATQSGPYWIIRECRGLSTPVYISRVDSQYSYEYPSAPVDSIYLSLQRVPSAQRKPFFAALDSRSIANIYAPKFSLISKQSERLNVTTIKYS